MGFHAKAPRRLDVDQRGERSPRKEHSPRRSKYLYGKAQVEKRYAERDAERSASQRKVCDLRLVFGRHAQNETVSMNTRSRRRLSNNLIKRQNLSRRRNDQFGQVNRSIGGNGLAPALLIDQSNGDRGCPHIRHLLLYLLLQETEELDHLCLFKYYHVSLACFFVPT